MATFQPILNQSSTNPFISPGVQDNSMAQLIGDLGKMGVEAYTGYQGAQLEGAIEQETLDFFSQNQAYDEGVQAGIDAEGVSKGIDSFWKGAETNIADVNDLNVLERGFREKMDKYASAMKQGKMSADQLYARIISTTREHVSRNPWLQKELLKTADNYLELTGLGGYIKEAQKNAKETADFQAKVIEQEAKYAATVGIDPLTDPLWMDKTRQRRITISNYEDKKKQLEMIKEMRPGMLGNLISNMEQLRPATFMSLQDKAVAITTSLDQNGKPLPWDVQKMQLQNLWNTYVSDTRSAFVRADPTSISDPNVSEYLKWMGEESKNFITELQNMKSGEEATKWFENRQKLISAQEKLVISGAVNRDALQVFGNMIQYMPEPARNRVLSLMLPQTMSAANSIFSRIAPLDMTTSALPVLDVILEAGKAGRPIGTELGAFIQSSTKGINDPNIVKTPIEKLKYLSGINAKMASVNELANLKQLSPEDREAAVKLTQEYKDIAMFNAQKGDSKREGLESLAARGVNLEWNQLPNGDFTLTYAPGSKKDDAALAKLNTTFAGHINNAHKALSHLYGRTDYNAVFKEIFMGQSQPGQTKTSNPTLNVASTLKSLQSIAAEYNKALEVGDKVGAEALMQKMQSLEQELGGGVDQQFLEQGVLPGQTPIAPTIPTLSPEAKERLSAPQEIPKPAPVKTATPTKQGVKPGDPTKAKTVINITGAKDIYKPEPKLSEAAKQSNKEVMERSKKAIDQAEREVVGESIMSAPLKHMNNQEAIIKRADAISRGDKTLYVSQDRDRIKASPNGKWAIYSQGDGKIRMYSPVEKVYVDVALKDVPLLEKWFKLPVEQWKKWNK